ncbi:hypothetical protein H6G06_13575 [Anabaena sphaerica FACHB-251]|uniref:Tetratricopeptide repeat protein n=1 Tax=Anabaena sphaerica FACHB-251 TaxID=2692883 RepID=A0A926WJV2_9NOST|nr:hypothetical protein [Anabaena sphaerica]MBD2294478.1 hypothetical protein [Anabaena sphaerica FACHB-251]
MKNFSQIWNCPDILEFRCPQEWDSLNQTEDRDVRYCKVCSQNVYMCSTPQEFTKNAKSGKCVAIPNELAHRPEDPKLVLGRPSQETCTEIEQQKRLISEFIAWWKVSLTSEPSFFPTFVRKCYDESYLNYQKQQFALDLLEFEQFDRFSEIAKSLNKDKRFLNTIIEQLISIGRFDIAMDVVAAFKISSYRVAALNYLALESARLGQIERAIDIFELNLQTARSLVNSKKYEAAILQCAASIGITLPMQSNIALDQSDESS